MKRLTTFLMVLLLGCLELLAAPIDIRILSTVKTSSSDESRCMLIDHKGLLWFGTTSGLKRFDGYGIKTYRSDASSPNVLPNNTVLALTEDHQEQVWIGTRNGLVCMDKRKGTFHTYHLPANNQKIIYTLFTSKDGTVWIGTDGGLTRYIPSTHNFYTYNSANTFAIEPNGKKKRVDNYSIKSIVEDKDGTLYLGTWEHGIYRLDPKRKTMYHYGKELGLSSAYSLCLDSKGQLWVGTWGHGVICLTHPRNQKSPGIIRFAQEGAYSIITKIIEDPLTHTIWASSREGVSIIHENNLQEGFLHYPDLTDSQNEVIPQNVWDMATDKRGNIWLLTLNKGIMHINTLASPFKSYQIASNNLPINSVLSIFSTDRENLWMTLSPFGIAYLNRQNDKIYVNRDIPFLKNADKDFTNHSYPSLIGAKEGELWFSTNGNGVIRYKDEMVESLPLNTSSTLYDLYTNILYKSKDGTIWIGQRSGLSYTLPSGKTYRLTMKEGSFNLTHANIRGITEDHKGNLWVSTEDYGIIRISGNKSNPNSFKYKSYNPTHANYVVNDAIQCLEDSHHRLWAISNSGGLFRYDSQTDQFVSVNKDLKWNVNRIFSIIEDSKGSLWLTTDESLICLSVPTEGNSSYITFSKDDGLGDVLFMPNAAYKIGNELFWGNRNSLISVDTDMIYKKKRTNASNLLVTNLLINDKNYMELDSAFRMKVSDVTPEYMTHLTIPASVYKFGVEFSLLSYTNTKDCKYAYLLEGYDKDWHYVDASVRQASFENLPSGSYNLRIKAADSHGSWQELPYSIHIKVLPPWYASWWAYLIYIALCICGVIVSIKWYKEHLRTKNRLQMGVIFTNITHELLTPLTVISAAVESMKTAHPDMGSQADLVHKNINRLTRMLRQILEVRKAQAGKLRLKVSKISLRDFCQETCQSLMPMFQQKKISFTQDITCLGTSAWVDFDKVEKILYNLLSNAAKYTPEGGNVNLTVSIDGNIATLKVSDTGIGLSEYKLKHLYDRFLDGDYRKMNTMGTGIGLSLVNDLVKLHHGHIHCESQENKGTTFTITLPINKDSYSEQEISEENITGNPKAAILDMPTNMEISATSEGSKQTDSQEEQEYTILLVEDNTELLSLMRNLLSPYYKVKTATNGEKAQRIIQGTPLDIIVTDVMMPVMDGIELTKWIKGNADYSQLPVIMLTAKVQNEDKNAGYQVGADEYLTKPFNLADLRVRIDNIIANRERIRQRFQQQTDIDIIEAPHCSDPKELFIKEAISKIKENLLDSEYNREELASDLCISGSTLYNKLRAYTGMNISSFITSIRLKEACKILRSEPNIRISELSDRVGFSTPRYFSQCFKKEYGMLVKDYVEQNIKG